MSEGCLVVLHYVICSMRTGKDCSDFIHHRENEVDEKRGYRYRYLSEV